MDTSSESTRSNAIATFPFVDNAPIISANQDRVLPRQMSSGKSRGENTITGSMVIVDENDSTQRIVIGNVNGEFGVFGVSLETNDPNAQTVIWKIVGQTYYFYDLVNGSVNIMQVGKLPDATFGWAVAKTGINVSEAY